MRAAFLDRQGVVAIRETAVPELDRDQVLVRVASVGVCGSDVHYYRHGRIGPYVVDTPLILGHELSGTITAVGADVDVARVGQRVAVEPQRPCRVCEQCKAGRYNLCPDIEFFATPPIDGAFVQYVAIQEDFAFEIPDHVSFDAAALIEPLSVCIWAAQRARIGLGARVLVAGAGPIGVIMAQTAKAFGAVEVIVTDINPQRRELALRMGATRAVDPRVESVSGLDVDAFIDASGVAQAMADGITAVRSAGYAVLVGLGADEVMMPVSYIQNHEVWVSGVFRYANTWPLGIELVSSGKVNLDALVTHVFPLDEAEAALQATAFPDSLKVIVRPNQMLQPS